MKRIKRLLVLQHLEIESPGLFEKFAKEKDLQIEVVSLDKKDPLPETKNMLNYCIKHPLQLKEKKRLHYSIKQQSLKLNSIATK